MRILFFAALRLVAAGAATCFRYGSLHPCDWMERDLAEDSGLPLLAVQARIAAEFLVEGITEPGPSDCLFRWWEFRQNGLPQS